MTSTLTFSNTYYDLGEGFFSKVAPRGLRKPQFVCHDKACAQLLGLDQFKAEDFVNHFSGNTIPESAIPLSMIYAGHQFGAYNPQLGDGRGVLLGEVKTADEGQWDVHLKGAGITPWSRFGDGYAVLRSCIREYLASIALHGLGIPTTHALCIVRGDDAVQRENIEPAAILTRVARTHIRFGHFEYFHYNHQHEKLKRLADYTIRQLLPSAEGKSTCYDELFAYATRRTAELIAHWQVAGFAHGVMNTDNMSIIGDTFDYGPYGFMEDYNPAFICNHSDPHGRYAFDQQPSIGLWNLNALAAALSSLLDQNEARNTLENYESLLLDHYFDLLYKKLGWLSKQGQDKKLIAKLFTLMHSTNMDYTLFFRCLSYVNEDSWRTGVLELMDGQKEDMALWLDAFTKRSQANSISLHEQQSLMLKHNPKYILRNYLAQQAIDEAYKNTAYNEIATLTDLLKKPFDEHPGMEKYAARAPSWTKDLAVSCSS